MKKLAKSDQSLQTNEFWYSCQEDDNEVLATKMGLDSVSSISNRKPGDYILVNFKKKKKKKDYIQINYNCSKIN